MIRIVDIPYSRDAYIGVLHMCVNVLYMILVDKIDRNGINRILNFKYVSNHLLLPCKMKKKVTEQMDILKNSLHYTRDAGITFSKIIVFSFVFQNIIYFQAILNTFDAEM